MQFVTAGVISSVVGYFQYYACATMNKSPGYIANDCLDRGPGANKGNNSYYDLFCFCLQVALVWLAFFLLPFSKEKGEPRFQYDDVKQE
jgi:hypothetical protein